MFDIDGIVRYIAGYSKIPDKDGEYPLEVKTYFSKKVSLTFLQKLFKVNPNDPDEGERYLIDPQIINIKIAQELQPFINENLEFDKYNYRLQCHSNEESKYIFSENNNENELLRFIAAWKKDPDAYGNNQLEIRYEFQKPISVDFLRKLFNVTDLEDQLIFYEINQQHATALQPYINEKFDLSRYNYTLRAIHVDAYKLWKRNKLKVNDD